MDVELIRLAKVAAGASDSVACGPLRFILAQLVNQALGLISKMGAKPSVMVSCALTRRPVRALSLRYEIAFALDRECPHIISRIGASSLA